MLFRVKITNSLFPLMVNPQHNRLPYNNTRISVLMILNNALYPESFMNQFENP